MNVVFILIDDLGHYGISAYGAEKMGSVQDFFDEVEFETPNVDSLARDGVLCESAYTYPLCEPTRISLMSGQYNSRNFLESRAQHESDITFGDLFQRAGYETCMVGKWKQSRGTDSRPSKDYIYGFGWDEFCCFDVVSVGLRMIEPNIVKNGEVMNYKGINPETGRRYYGPDIFNEYALDFIDRNKDKPFFLYYPMVLMHDEHTPTPDTKPESIYDNHDVTKPSEYGAMKGDDRRYYPDMLSYADKMIGNVLKKLEEHNLDDNTLVVIMGDNGTKECFYYRLKDGSKYIGDKGSNKEGGTHVPLLLRAPGKIPAGKKYSSLVSVVDILPTLCDAVGVEVPNKDKVDGISFWDQATGKSDKDHRDHIYVWYNHKPSHPENLIEYAFTKEFKRYSPSALYPDKEGRFFDLRTDLFETFGKEKKKVPMAWQKYHYSGIEIDDLTREQKKAYDKLGKVLKAHAYVPVKGVEVRKSEVPLKIGATQKLECKIMPENATRRGVVWESSDPEIASVNKFGEITAHKKGSVTVSAYSWDDANPSSSARKGTIEYKTDGINGSANFLIQ